MRQPYKLIHWKLWWKCAHLSFGGTILIYAFAYNCLNLFQQSHCKLLNLRGWIYSFHFDHALHYQSYKMDSEMIWDLLKFPNFEYCPACCAILWVYPEYGAVSWVILKLWEFQNAPNHFRIHYKNVATTSVLSNCLKSVLPSGINLNETCQDKFKATCATRWPDKHTYACHKICIPGWAQIALLPSWALFWVKNPFCNKDFWKIPFSRQKIFQNFCPFLEISNDRPHPRIPFPDYRVGMTKSVHQLKRVC